jgi:hypothetical protein
VIVAPGGAPGALAAKSATTTIPIVFEMGADPIAIGLVGNMNRPGGNLTGVSSLNVQVTPKRLEILHEVVPTAAEVVYRRPPILPVLFPILPLLRMRQRAGPCGSPQKSRTKLTRCYCTVGIPNPKPRSSGAFFKHAANWWRMPPSHPRASPHKPWVGTILMVLVD